MPSMSLVPDRATLVPDRAWWAFGCGHGRIVLAASAALEGEVVVAERDRSDDRRPAPRTGDRRDAASGRPSRLLGLQGQVGNAATPQLLNRASSTRSGPVAVQRNAKFDQAATTPYDKAAAPQDMGIPIELQDGLQAAWDASFPGGKSQEQGGILVLTKDGKYVWRAGKGTGAGRSR